MNFFEAQDKAHKRTGFLVTMLAVGMAAMSVGLYFVCMLVFHMLGMWEASKQTGDGQPRSALDQFALNEMGTWWDWRLAAAATSIMVLLVGGGFLYRYLHLRSGGSAVAEMLGGVRIDPDTHDQSQRRALNVVEEMAIASGVPVPPVFELPSTSINAFAAGHTVDQAAIGLTRGCIELPRAELQGVVAHEFSHVFNGDMRLNLRLIALINGVMVLGITGLLLVRVVGRAFLYGGFASRGGGKSKDNGAAVGLAIIVLGLLIAAIGFMGTLVARMIQAAVSRQREFLADATAVQYTRNPDGISGALARIGGYAKADDFAGEASQFNHMFFSQALPAMFATHPPLEDRIQRITGSTEMPDVKPITTAQADQAAPASPPNVAGAVLAGVAVASIRNALDHAGEVQSISMDWTRQVLESIPDELRSAARSPQCVRALIAAMLMHEADDTAVAARQAEALKRYLPEVEQDRVATLTPHVAALPETARVPLLDLTSSAVQSLSDSQGEDLKALVEALVEADRTVSRFEWVVVILVDAMLERRGEATHSARAALKSMPDAVMTLLSVTASAGTEDATEARAAVGQACATVGLPEPAHLPEVSLQALGQAVHDVQSLKFTQRSMLLSAVIDVVSHDGRTTLAEAEMVRAVAELLAVPMPPVMPDAA